MSDVTGKIRCFWSGLNVWVQRITLIGAVMGIVIPLFFTTKNHIDQYIVDKSKSIVKVKVDSVRKECTAEIQSIRKEYNSKTMFLYNQCYLNRMRGDFQNSALHGELDTKMQDTRFGIIPIDFTDLKDGFYFKKYGIDDLHKYFKTEFDTTDKNWEISAVWSAHYRNKSGGYWVYSDWLDEYINIKEEKE